ncbi:very short patch repair endonuclease [Actinokineospora spheciospongiae]|nr:very short patch repair endonuclease [Actinokineospora spheciospongiae]
MLKIEGSWASSASSRAVMRANKRKDTRIELRLRTALHSRGLRYRVDAQPVKGIRRRADVVFTAARVAVFVDGCFWHGCPEHYRPASKNAVFWSAKIEGNQARDAETDRLLDEAGWRVIRVWEHEPVDDCARRIEDTVRARRGGGSDSRGGSGVQGGPPPNRKRMLA